MKNKYYWLSQGLFAVIATMAIASGWENATRIDVGSYVGTRVITLSAASNTQVFAANVNRPDETCFNNSAVTVWIGTNTAGTTLTSVGFPVLSSSTVKFGGYTGGDVYGLLNSGAGEFRCWDGQTR